MGDKILVDNMPDDVMAVRWAAGKEGEIPWGSWLIVQQGQVAVVYKDGATMEVFGQGKHEVTQKIPIFTKFAEKVPFMGGMAILHATVYFVNVRPFMDLRWGTPSPVYMNDPVLKRIPVRANGRFSVEISDAAVFCARLVGTNPVYRTGQMEANFREMHITPLLTSLLVKLKKPFNELVEDQVNLAIAAKAMAAEALTPYGLRLNELAVLAITTTEEIQAKLDKLSQIEVDAIEIERKRQAELKGVGATSAADLGQYEMMKGIGAGQAKGGGTGAAGAGASMGEAGMAMMMPMMMAQMMNQMKQQTAPQPGAAPAPAASDLTTRLKKLKELFEGGLIDEATYKARREEILKEI